MFVQEAKSLVARALGSAMAMYGDQFVEEYSDYINTCVSRLRIFIHTLIIQNRKNNNTKYMFSFSIHGTLFWGLKDFFLLCQNQTKGGVAFSGFSARFFPLPTYGVFFKMP